MRLIDAEIAYDKIAEQETSYYMDMEGVQAGLDETPTVDAVEVVRCKECKHRPEYYGPNRLVFPDEVCPCQCDDLYYNWMPSDDWFCGDGERRDNE